MSIFQHLHTGYLLLQIIKKAYRAPPTPLELYSSLVAYREIKP